MGTIRLLGQVGRGEDVGGAEAGADPGKQRARLLVLERPLQRVRVQRVLPVEPQLHQRHAQRGPAHPRRRLRPRQLLWRRWEAVVVDWSGGWAAVRGRQRLLCLRCVSSKQREQNRMGSAACWGMGFRRKLENSDRSLRGLAIGFQFFQGLKMNGLCRSPCAIRSLAGGPPLMGLIFSNEAQ